MTDTELRLPPVRVQSLASKNTAQGQALMQAWFGSGGIGHALGAGASNAPPSDPDPAPPAHTAASGPAPSRAPQPVLSPIKNKDIISPRPSTTPTPMKRQKIIDLSEDIPSPKKSSIPNQPHAATPPRLNFFDLSNDDTPPPAPAQPSKTKKRVIEESEDEEDSEVEFMFFQVKK